MPASMKDRKRGETIARVTAIATTATSVLIAMRRRITTRGWATEISIAGISRQRLSMATMPRIPTTITIATTVIAIGIEIGIGTTTEIGTEIGIVTAMRIETTIGGAATGIAMG